MTTGGRQPLRLMETWRSIFYTPFYVSVAGGFLEREGLDVEFSTCPAHFPHPLSALHHDVADIVQSGIIALNHRVGLGRGKPFLCTSPRSTQGMVSSSWGGNRRRPLTGSPFGEPE